jgi:predicted phosphoribosyltransferase
MGEILDNPQLREKRFVFADRHDAGRQLGALLKTVPDLFDPVVLAIPAGGVPVGREVAQAFSARLSLAIVRKIRIPGNTESGFGAVTWDGQVVINEELLAALRLSTREVEHAVAETRENVRERIGRFMADKTIPFLKGKTVILTDDGLASGYTMLAAIQSIRQKNPSRIVIAVPTASLSAAQRVALHADLVVSPNIRSSRMFAVADAYEDWYDLNDDEVLRELGGI